MYPTEVGQRDAYEFVIRSLTGSTFVGRSDDFHARKFGVYGYNEWKLWAFTLALCASSDNVIEAGAHVGTETVGYADLLRGGRVFAFEPSAKARRSLERTLALAGIRNVTVFPFALGERQGVVPFAHPSSEISSGIGHVLGPREKRTGRIEYVDRLIETPVTDVAVRTLDSMAASLPSIRLLALDAEGSEPSILRGARRLIQRDLPAIVVEAFAPHLERAGTTVDAMHAQLSDLGYTVFAIRRLSLMHLPTAQPGRVFDNWLCVHETELDSLPRIRRTLRWCGALPAIAAIHPLARAASRRASFNSGASSGRPKECRC